MAFKWLPLFEKILHIFRIFYIYRTYFFTYFFSRNWKKKSPEASIFQSPQHKRSIIVTDTEAVYDPGGFLSVV